MIASHSCCRFVVCTSMMWISRSTTSQRCSIGLRSGDCGGHLSKVNSLWCSRNQSETIWALCHGALSCWKYIRRWYTVVIKGWTWSATILRCLNDAQLVLKCPKCANKISPTPPPPAWTIETKQDGFMLSCSLRQTLILKSECRSRNWDSSDVFPIFYCPILVSRCELYPPCAFLIWKIFLSAPGVVFCCWSPSASGFDVLCVQRWYSADLGCNEWLFELLLSFYHL